MLSNAYFLAKFRFDTAENDPAKNLQQKNANFANFVNFVNAQKKRARAMPPAYSNPGTPRSRARTPDVLPCASADKRPVGAPPWACDDRECDPR